MLVVGGVVGTGGKMVVTDAALVTGVLGIEFGFELIIPLAIC
jgi:hypothetical protein